MDQTHSSPKSVMVTVVLFALKSSWNLMVKEISFFFSILKSKNRQIEKIEFYTSNFTVCKIT